MCRNGVRIGLFHFRDACFVCLLWLILILHTYNMIYSVFQSPWAKSANGGCHRILNARVSLTRGKKPLHFIQNKNILLEEKKYDKMVKISCIVCGIEQKHNTWVDIWLLSFFSCIKACRKARKWLMAQNDVVLHGLLIGISKNKTCTDVTSKVICTCTDETSKVIWGFNIKIALTIIIRGGKPWKDKNWCVLRTFGDLFL